MLAHSIPFAPEHDAEAFAQIPAAPGVFLLRGHDPSAEPYVSKSANLRRRVQRLLAPPENQSKRLNLRERCGTIEFSQTGSDFENGLLLYRVLREIFPEGYAKRMRLNMAPVIRIHWENTYPRAYVTRKLPAVSGERAEGFSPGSKSVYYGPFPSRVGAEKFLNDALDLFKSRRCTFELHPDPSFPGCVYSEMKMCLAPCFQGCPDDEYVDEVRRVQKFLDTCGDSLIAELEAERDQASANLEFELAANLHLRIEKVRGVVRGCDDIIRRLDQLDALILQPSTEPDSIALFRFVNGQLLGPQTFRAQNILLSNEKSGDSSLYAQPMMAQPVPEIPETAAKPVSLEMRLVEALEELVPETKTSALNFSEQLALLKRWHYRSSRVGEIFLRDRDGAWPYRKMVRGVPRVLAGKLTENTESQPNSGAIS
ncbi:MAG TPA: UvrB/UvrC motif-containing protein [Terriglobales bacterium]|nr:UvrB/UvrC motif-containing protein [Terriglobales bacterium]